MHRIRHVAPWIALAIAFPTCEGCQGQREPAPAPVPLAPGPATNAEPSSHASKIEPVAPELGFTVENFPRVDGSTSTQPLLMMVACKILAAPYESAHFEKDDSQRLYASWFAEALQGRATSQPLCEQVNRLVQTHGTGEAYVNLIKRNADFILAARLPADDELELARQLGVELDGRPVALDAFVFLLNKQNPVSGLSLEQIRDIYSGRVVNWKQVGGSDAAIRPYQRPRNSGSQELMQRRVMKGRAMIPARDLLTGTLMSFPFLALDKDVNGIGYSVYYYHEFMSPPRNIKLCAVDGILATPADIRARRYPLVTEVYVVVRKDDSPPRQAYRLRDWILSTAGQAIVEESGYVPVQDIAWRSR